MKTIKVKAYAINDNETFTQDKARQILNFSHPHKFREHLDALGLARRGITWEGIKLILACRLFLMAGHGKHSKEMFGKIYKNGLLDKAMQQFNINLEAEFEKVKDGYYSSRTK